MKEEGYTMENAADALKIAFGIIMFVAALSVPVIYEKGRVGKAVFFGVAEQDVFLIGDGIAIALVGVLLRKSAV